MKRGECDPEIKTGGEEGGGGSRVVNKSGIEVVFLTEPLPNLISTSMNENMDVNLQAQSAISEESPLLL